MEFLVTIVPKAKVNFDLPPNIDPDSAVAPLEADEAAMVNDNA